VKRSIPHIFYTWLIIGLAFWQLSLLFPALDLDHGRELLAIVLMGVLAEWLVVSLPHGQLSGGFALILATFLIYGLPATAWVAGLSTMLGQGIVNRGNPMRTTLFNSGQYVLAAAMAAFLYDLAGGTSIAKLSVENLVPLAVFVFAYIIVNHVLVYFYLLPGRRRFVQATWWDALWLDGITYLFSVPVGLLIAILYARVGLLNALVLFLAVLAGQFILRFYVRLQAANRGLTLFYETARRLGEGHGPKKLLSLILYNTRRVIFYHSGIAYLWSAERRAYLPVVVVGPYAKQLRCTVMYKGEDFIGGVLENREAEIVFDTWADPRTRNEPGLCQVFRSMLIVPLVAGAETPGVIVLGDKRPMSFDEKDRHVLTVLAAQAGMSIANVMFAERLESASALDSYTGLYNYSHFYEQAKTACEQASIDKSSVGLIIIDIDQFKVFNNRYGRLSGEKVLFEMAVLLEGTTRKRDLVGRYGGDEFVVLLPHANGARALEIAEDLRRAVRGQLFLGDAGKRAMITISMGVATFPRDAGTVDELFGAAQQALEWAKINGRDRVVQYSDIGKEF